jgi:hypothetical protein
LIGFCLRQKACTINAEATVVPKSVIAAGRRGCTSFVLDFFASFLSRKKEEKKEAITKRTWQLKLTVRGANRKLFHYIRGSLQKPSNDCP